MNSKFENYYFPFLLICFSAGALTVLAIWGKAPRGGDEFAFERFTILGLSVMVGHFAFQLAEKWKKSKQL